MKKRMDAEKKVDPSVYEYDELYDQMQEIKQRQKEAKQLDAKERKVRCLWFIHGQLSKVVIQPKYINGLLTAAATRRLDHLRAEEKMMQLEREAEGDMYKDKEAFVTQAYKDQMAEVRRAEEEERMREGTSNHHFMNLGLSQSTQSNRKRKTVHQAASHSSTVKCWRNPNKTTRRR